MREKQMAGFLKLEGLSGEDRTKMAQELAEECIYMRAGNTASLIYPAQRVE